MPPTAFCALDWNEIAVPSALSDGLNGYWPSNGTSPSSMSTRVNDPSSPSRTTSPKLSTGGEPARFGAAVMNATNRPSALTAV